MMKKIYPAIKATLPGIVLLIVLFSSCSQRVISRFATMEDVASREAAEQRKSTPCYQFLNYAPDTNYLSHTPIRHIRVNFHIMDSQDSLHNFRREEGKKWVTEFLYAANTALAQNEKAVLPEGNSIPTLPLRYRYILTPQPGDPTDDGIYFHYDDSCYYYISKGKNSNIYESTVFEKYGIQKDTVLNIFLMPHHPDSVKSKTYGGYGTGVALGKYVKIGGKFKELNSWELRGTLNHEIGHIFSLVHAWAYEDGCDDTPRHSLEVFSNNIMDYNSSQLSFTPCQIGKIHARMSTPDFSARKLLLPSWCVLQNGADIIIQDSVIWDSQKDLEGNVLIEPGGTLRLLCRLSLPEGAKIVIKPGGKLVLEDALIHNSCGKTWEGIEVQRIGKITGIVQMTAQSRLEDMVHPLEENNR